MEKIRRKFKPFSSYFVGILYVEKDNKYNKISLIYFELHFYYTLKEEVVYFSVSICLITK